MNSSLDGEWLLAVHQQLYASALTIVSRDYNRWLAKQTRCDGHVKVPWEPMLPEVSGYACCLCARTHRDHISMQIVRSLPLSHILLRLAHRPFLMMIG